jgi:hypothetical protein
MLVFILTRGLYNQHAATSFEIASQQLKCSWGVHCQQPAGWWLVVLCVDGGSVCNHFSVLCQHNMNNRHHMFALHAYPYAYGDWHHHQGFVEFTGHLLPAVPEYRSRVGQRMHRPG